MYILSGHIDTVFSLATLPNSNIVSGGRDTIVKILQSEFPFECITTLYGHPRSVSSFAIFLNSNKVSGSRDTTIKIW
jgi:phospholipase A-2-activating protein